MIERRGRFLAAELNRLVDAADNRETAIAAMARAAGISPSTVSQILRAEIDIPPLGRLRGFARALGVSLASLQRAAERDGASYETRRRFAL